MTQDTVEVLPLSFFTKEKTDEIGNFKIDSIVRDILQKNSCLDPIESRAFADIIFYEIGKNIFDHAFESFELLGLISICMIKKNIWSSDEYGKWDASYFRQLGNRAYLQIVIGDQGKGVFDTLFKAYTNDEHLNKRYLVKGLRCDEAPYVIRYAFDKLSSRHLNHSRLMFPDIPRGLSWVYDIVREYRGFIGARSGSTRLGISFLPGQSGAFKFETDLADFGGTILQIIIPECNPSEVFSFKLSSQPFPTQEISLHWFSITRFWKGRTDTQESYFNLLTALDRTVRGLDETDVVLVDFSDIVWDKNFLSEFVRKLIYLQGEVLIACININIHHFSLLHEVERLFLADDGPIKESDLRITPFIDFQGKVFFLGCRSMAERNLLHELFEIETADPNSLLTELSLMEVAKFISRNRHIVRKIGPNLIIRASASAFSSLIEKAISDEIGKVLGNPPDGITIKHIGIFHLPSGKYATEFIQLGHLLQIGNWAKKISYALLMKLHFYTSEPKVDFIFGCTASTSPLIECIAEELSLDLEDSTLCIENYLDSINHPDVEDIPKSANVLIVTDVISTGDLIERMVQAVLLRKAHPLAVIAIVDTRQHFESKIEIDHKQIPVLALFHEYIQKTIEPQPSQLSLFPNEANAIIEIDPLTASPCYDVVYPPPVLIESKDLFENYLLNSFAVINQHVVTGGTHFCFYVDTRMIFQNAQIVSKILVTVTESLRKNISRSTREITILYPWGSNASLAVHLIRSTIREKIEIDKIHTRSIFRSKSKSGWRFGQPDRNYEHLIKDKLVVIWDDGSNSGDTLYQLIDYASSLKPKKILVYILISRLEPFHRRFAQQVRSYAPIKKGKVPVKVIFITSLDLPTYKPNNCPCCSRLRELENDTSKGFSNLESVMKHIEREKKRLRPVRLRNIRKEIKRQDFISLSEMPQDSEDFRRDIARLVVMREYFARIQSLIPTEQDRRLLRQSLADKKNIQMLVKVIRDEPEVLDRISRQIPDAVDYLFLYSAEHLFDKEVEVDGFDLSAIEVLFRNGKHKMVLNQLENFIRRIQSSNEAINSFLYHVLKFLDPEEAFETLENCRNICEASRTGKMAVEARTRVKLGKAIQWARLSKAKKAGREGTLKQAIVSLSMIYQEDPHKSGMQLFNTLMGTSRRAAPGSWAKRYSWLKGELSPIFSKMVGNIETIQPILSVIPSLNTYLLMDSIPNLTDDLTDLDGKLHILSLENIEAIVRDSSYEDFELIVDRIYRQVISEKSGLVHVISGFPTNVLNAVKSVIELLESEIESTGLTLELRPIPENTLIIFNTAVFYKVFREILLNMCKYCRKNGRATIEARISDELVEIFLMHSGSSFSAITGMGQIMLREAMEAHKGQYYSPVEVQVDNILTKLVFRRW